MFEALQRRRGLRPLRFVSLRLAWPSATRDYSDTNNKFTQASQYGSSPTYSVLRPPQLRVFYTPRLLGPLGQLVCSKSSGGLFPGRLFDLRTIVDLN